MKEYDDSRAVPAQDKTPKAPTEAKALRSLPNQGGNAKRSEKNRRKFRPRNDNFGGGATGARG